MDIHVHSVQYLQTHVCSVTVCRYTRVAHVSSLPAGFRAWLGGCHGQGAGRGRAPDPQHHRGRRHQHQLKNMYSLCVQFNTTDINLYLLLLCKLIVHDVPPTGACLLPTSHVLLLTAPTCAARRGLGELRWCQGIRAGNEPS